MVSKGIERTQAMSVLHAAEGDIFLSLQESSQRCASEIIAGMVSGSKNWNYEMVGVRTTF